MPLYPFIGGGGGVSTSGVVGNIIFKSGATTRAYLTPTGWSFYGGTSPSAYIHIGAGTATAGTAPFKMTSGTILATGEVGADEYDVGNVIPAFAVITPLTYKGTIKLLVPSGTTLPTLTSVLPIDINQLFPYPLNTILPPLFVLSK